MKKAGSVGAFIAPYVDRKNRATVRSGRLKISYTDYSWSLNRQ